MPFNPQANMVSDESAVPARHAAGGLRAGVLIVIIAMAAAFGSWIYKQVDLGPAGASAASMGPQPHMGPEYPQPAPAARRSDMSHRSVRRSGNATTTAGSVTPTSEGGATSGGGRTAAHPSTAPGSEKSSAPEVLFTDSRRRYAVRIYNEGQTALSAGHHAQAAALFQRAIELDAGYADAYYALGIAHIMSGNRAQAIEQLRRLREMDENMANLLASLLK